MYTGSFIFVLHSHVPYVRQSGKWPHGEEMLFEIMAETYIPLLNALNRLYQEKSPAKITLGLTPVLLEQLADPYLQAEFITYIKNRIKAANKDLEIITKDLPESKSVIEFYISWYAKILYDFEHVYGKDLINAFKFLQDKAKLDIVTCAATHGYLPLLSRDSAIRGQLKTGIRNYKKYFGKKPTGIWLPECGYRPLTKDKRAGIENFLEEVGVQYFFTDSHVIENAIVVHEEKYLQKKEIQTPQTVAQNDTYQTTNSQTVVQHPFIGKFEPLKKIITQEETKTITTFHGYTVSHTNVFVLGRDKLTGLQVWSADWGYPGDWLYREFHKKAPTSGIQYWKITNKMPGLKNKEIYNPVEAFRRAEEHARHFTEIVTRHLEEYYQTSGRHGVIVSAYDTELFGHWWFEGVHWLECVIRGINNQKKIRLLSAQEYVNEQTSDAKIDLPESSWGNGGKHATWLNSDTEYMWPIIHAAEERFERMVEQTKRATKMKKDILNQAARELLLLQSSDWPFLISTVQARDFAQKKFETHVERFNALMEMLEQNKINQKYFDEISKIDNLFQEINYKDFI